MLSKDLKQSPKFDDISNAHDLVLLYYSYKILLDTVIVPLAEQLSEQYGYWSP